jgi:hypothetical protein
LRPPGDAAGHPLITLENGNLFPKRAPKFNTRGFFPFLQRTPGGSNQKFSPVSPPTSAVRSCGVASRLAPGGGNIQRGASDSGGASVGFGSSSRVATSDVA